MRRSLPLALALALLGDPAGVRAATTDVGIAGSRLVLASRGRILFDVRRDARVDAGPAGNRGALEVALEVFYEGEPGRLRAKWTMPPPWAANRGDVARFENASAPRGPTTISAATIRRGRSLRIAGRGLGDAGVLADLGAGPPMAAGGVLVVVTVRNSDDTSTRRMCTAFAAAGVRYRTGRRGQTLVARRGQPSPCPAAVVEQPHMDECEVLNAASCLLPYPSSHFLVPADTPTGLRVRVPQAGIPHVIGQPVPADPIGVLDGFSPGVQILMHFPQGVDPERSHAARLLPANCCGQPAGPPWIDTRTYTDRSRDADSPTLLIDAATGERILHFIEPDARAAGNPARQILFLRPASLLAPGHRYLVAARGLVSPSGAPVTAEAVFAALRDDVPTSVPAVEARRPQMRLLLAELARFGVPGDDLLLAFDFVVGSDQSLTHVMTSMRDQAYDWLEAVEADPAAVSFRVESVRESDCSVPGQATWRYVAGRFTSPLFLTGDLVQDGVQFDNLDAGGTPVQNGTTEPPFTVAIPCSVLDPGIVSRPVIFGHGLGQTGDFMTSAIPPLVNAVVPWTGIAAATDWRGLSGNDLAWVGTRIIGIGESQLHNFAALPARLRQGMLNTLVLARMMKRGLFNRHPAFLTPDGRPVLPGPSEDLVYYGISLGGIMGTYFAGLTPDVERFGLDVPAVNFSCMLQRAEPFAGFDVLLPGIGITDPLDAALGIQLLHEIWASGEPVSVARHITRDPLPGSGGPKRILITEAFLDKQVSNVCTEIEARTLGLPTLEGSIRQGLVDMPDRPGPLDSAFISWHLGELDILNPAHAPFIPALANLIPSSRCDPHPRRPTIPAAIRQLTAFLQPGGQVQNFCDGLCDGTSPDERPAGACTP